MIRPVEALPILTAEQMRSAEQRVFATGIPEYELMERAGAAAADFLWRMAGRRDTLILCGPGNNGGDGYVMARLLRDRGVPVRIAATGEPRTPSARQARAAWDGPVDDIMSARSAAHVVDALFGTGLTRGLEPALASRLCELAGEAGKVTAIDLPSGTATDSGQILSPLPAYSLCIALGALKPAHVLQPASRCFASLVCADIGIDAKDARWHALSPPAIAAPGPNDHKYTRGLVAVVGGAMPGASMLAARAAAHAGAGYVRLLTQSGEDWGPDAIVRNRFTSPGDLIEKVTDTRIGALLCGPGLGRTSDARAIVQAVLDRQLPTIFDADALAAMPVEPLSAPAILTPHEGEFRTLFGALPGSKIDRALAAADRMNAVIIYKGADTVIAAPDGRCAVAAGASNWLSTAGTGDVLAGIAAARLATTHDPFRAACEAVWLHGDAGRRAGPAFIADDLVSRIPAAIASRL